MYNGPPDPLRPEILIFMDSLKDSGYMTWVIAGAARGWGPQSGSTISVAGDAQRELGAQKNESGARNQYVAEFGILQSRIWATICNDY